MAYETMKPIGGKPSKVVAAQRKRWLLSLSRQRKGDLRLLQVDPQIRKPSRQVVAEHVSQDCGSSS